MEEERVGREKEEIILNNKEMNNNLKKKDGDGETNPINKGKSCKGCLYYSSTLKSNSRNPLCVGITRSLPQVPRNIVGKSEWEAHEEGRDFADFKYGCVGYSVYSDRKGQKDVKDKNELPACIGVEILVDRKATVAADSVPAHARTHTHTHNKEDKHRLPPPQTPKPPQSVGDEFLKRFTRNAGVVATGVAKNVRKVGNQVKSTFDDILYPYRRRPK